LFEKLGLLVLGGQHFIEALKKGQNDPEVKRKIPMRELTHTRCIVYARMPPQLQLNLSEAHQECAESVTPRSCLDEVNIKVN
jgi:hypothetical protein